MRFKVDDRVLVIGEIARYYKSRVGIITSAEQGAVSVLKEFTVRLADGRQGIFFDFQLQIPSAATARLELDTYATPQLEGVRGIGHDRLLRFITPHLDIHISVHESGSTRTILGQIISAAHANELALVSLLQLGQLRSTTTPTGAGEFRFDDVPGGHVTIEVFLPYARVLSSFTA
ncbi:MAG: hypothetical protein HY646_11445 [Acidobacteria bacterium]|nr:hypothetical protein [Acidobacteriota bacterium]